VLKGAPEPAGARKVGVRRGSGNGYAGSTSGAVTIRPGVSAVRAGAGGCRGAAREERLVLATGRYLGEGFDDARNDHETFGALSGGFLLPAVSGGHGKLEVTN